MSKISRREARICAVKVMYCADFHKDEDKNALFELVCSEGEIKYNDFAKALFFGASDNIEKIDEAISACAKGWKIERISKMSLAVLRVCAYELLFTETPAPIAINEAMEIDKAFDSDDAPAFVNGVLNSIARSNPKEKE